MLPSILHGTLCIKTDDQIMFRIYTVLVQISKTIRMFRVSNNAHASPLIIVLLLRNLLMKLRYIRYHVVQFYYCQVVQTFDACEFTTQLL